MIDGIIRQLEGALESLRAVSGLSGLSSIEMESVRASRLRAVLTLTEQLKRAVEKPTTRNCILKDDPT